MKNIVRRLESLLLFVVLGLSVSSRAQAESEAWTTNGPEGDCCVSVVAARDNLLFAASTRGIYRSRDGGNRWELSLAASPDGLLAGGFVTTLTIDPADPSVVFAGIGSYHGRVLLKSTDTGKSWKAITAGLTFPDDGYGYWLSALAIDPLDSRVLYAAHAREFAIAIGPGAVVKSLDGGESWQPLDSNLSGGCVTDLKIDPEDRRTLYAVTNGCGTHAYSTLAKSTDGGVGWARIDDGLPHDDRSTFYPTAEIRTIVIDPRNHSTLYVGTYDHGVYRSRDAGATWQPTNFGLPLLQRYSGYPVVGTLAFDQDGALYAGLDKYGLFKSVDGGQVCSPLNFGGSVTGLSIGVSSRSLIYLLGPHGLYRSADGGSSWKAADTGLVSARVEVVTTDPTSPGTVYAGTASFIYDHSDGHAPDGRWTPSDRSPGVFRSDDHGRTWSRTSLPARDVYLLTVDARTGWIYAGGRGWPLSRSEDHGATWRELQLPVQADIWSVASDSEHSTIYIGTVYAGILKSEDDGASWSTVNNGSIEGGPYIIVTSLAIDPSDSSVIFAATDRDGIYKSPDRGATWFRYDDGLTYYETCPNCYLYKWHQYVNRIAVDPSNPLTLYAGTSYSGDPSTGGVFKSEDGGRSWRRAGEGLLTAGSRGVSDVVIDPRQGHDLYIATFDGIYRSQDGAISWDPLRERIEDPVPRTIALDPRSPGALYAGTAAGVFTLEPRGASKPR
ncbi:MAG TPA: hypothetical protein VFC25_12930 [Verrucomicrobiae bacterium]|nr:hypothetical protein [Verrucomicrobiae bacterium]